MSYVLKNIYLNLFLYFVCQLQLKYFKIFQSDEICVTFYNIFSEILLIFKKNNLKHVVHYHINECYNRNIMTKCYNRICEKYHLISLTLVLPHSFSLDSAEKIKKKIKSIKVIMNLFYFRHFLFLFPYAQVSLRQELRRHRGQKNQLHKTKNQIHT